MSLVVGDQEIGDVKQMASYGGTASQTQQPFGLLGPFGAECYGCAWSRDGRYFAWSAGMRVVKVIRWNPQQLRQFQNETGDTSTVDDGMITTIDAGGLVHSLTFCQRARNARSYRKSERRRSSTTRLLVFDSDDDVTLVVGVRNGRIRTWDIETGSLKLELCDHTGAVSGLAFNSHGRPVLVSSSLDGTLKAWDMEDDGNLIATMKANSTTLYNCCCSPDGVTMASVGNYHSVHLWDLTTYKLRRRLEGHYNNVTGCEFSPDGVLLATSSYDSRVIVWDVSCGVALRYLEHCYPPLSPIYAGGANEAYVRSVSISNDCHHVATVCDDGYLRIWDIFEDDVPVQATNITSALVCRFSPGGSQLAVGSSRGDVTIWRSPTRVACLQHLCRNVIRRLMTSSGDIEAICCVPPPIRRFLQYSGEPIIACG